MSEIKKIFPEQFDPSKLEAGDPYMIGFKNAGFRFGRGYYDRALSELEKIRELDLTSDQREEIGAIYEVVENIQRIEFKIWVQTIDEINNNPLDDPNDFKMIVDYDKRLNSYKDKKPKKYIKSHSDAINKVDVYIAQFKKNLEDKYGNATFDDISEKRFIIDLEGFDADLRLELFAQDTVSKAVEMIKAGDDMQTVLDYIALQRKAFSLLNQDRKSLFENKFGEKRDDPMYTAIGYYVENNEDGYRTYEVYESRLNEKLGQRFSYQGVGMSIVRRWADRDTRKQAERPKRLPEIEIGHIDPDNIDKVLNFVEEIYNETTQKDIPSNQVIENLARMHWLLSQAMPYQRGSALITDQFIDSVAKAKGMKLSDWKQNVSPDLEAFCYSDIEEYVKIYPKLFKKEPEVYES